MPRSKLWISQSARQRAYLRRRAIARGGRLNERLRASPGCCLLAGPHPDTGALWLWLIIPECNQTVPVAGPVTIARIAAKLGLKL
jgi:hypothetical protein